MHSLSSSSWVCFQYFKDVSIDNFEEWFIHFIPSNAETIAERIRLFILHNILHDYIKFELTGVVSCKICLTNIQKTGQFCYLWVNTGSCRYCAQLIQNIMFQYCKNLFHFKETIGHTKENVISSIVFLLHRVSIKKLSGKI